MAPVKATAASDRTKKREKKEEIREPNAGKTKIRFATTGTMHRDPFLTDENSNAFRS
jgi:hypothetical protein